MTSGGNLLKRVVLSGRQGEEEVSDEYNPSPPKHLIL